MVYIHDNVKYVLECLQQHKVSINTISTSNVNHQYKYNHHHILLTTSITQITLIIVQHTEQQLQRSVSIELW